MESLQDCLQAKQTFYEGRTIVRNANVGYNFESAKHGEIVWDVSFPLLFSRAFCIIPLLTLLYFSEKQEEYLLNCMKIRLNGGYR